MRKGILAVLAVFLLLASFSAAEMAADKEKPLDAGGKAIGLNVNKEQCLCSADTLAKIEQIKKLLAELEESCYAGQQVEPQKPVEVSCVDNCLAEQKGYCEETCKKEEGLDKECYDGCYEGIKVKCENSCNMEKPEEKPVQAGCVESCYNSKYDKESCLSGCGTPGTVEYDTCYDECSKKAGLIWDECQNECAGQQPTTTTPVLDKCVDTCDEKYSECKESCHAGVTDVESLKQAEECTMNECIPMRDQCIKSCGDQYGKQETFVQKVVNVFKVKLHKSAKWECYDGTFGESWETCKPEGDFQAKAKESCEGKCSTATNKCGVNSFYVYGEC